MTTIDPRTPESGNAQPVWPPQQTPAPRKKSHLPLIIGGAVALVVAIVVSVIATLALAGGTRNAASPAGSDPVAAPAIEGCGAFCDEPEDAPTTAGPVLTKADLSLSAKITSKQCFGSAGCNVTLKVIADRAASGPVLSPDETWEVTYRITGDESGPIVGSFDITGDQYDVNEEILSTRSSKTKISIKVTDVEKIGI